MRLIIHTKSGNRLEVPLEIPETDAEKLCEEFYGPTNFTSMNTFRFGRFIVYCREIEALEFANA